MCRSCNLPTKCDALRRKITKKVDEIAKKYYNWYIFSLVGKEVSSMQPQPQPRYVFCYAYRPLLQRDPADIGFSVNLAYDGLLEYTIYNDNREPMKTLYYKLPQEVAVRYARIVDYAQPWLRRVPPLMSSGDEPVAEYSFVFRGNPLFRIEDLIQLIQADSFRNVRGHYTRLVYCLFEDIASILACYGVDLTPKRFSCKLQPLQPAMPQTPWQMPTNAVNY